MCGLFVLRRAHTFKLLDSAVNLLCNQRNYGVAVGFD